MKKALIADDTRNIRNLLTTCLELYGYEVLTAKNGIEALEIIENHDFDIVFLDVKMPELSGTEVLRRIRIMNLSYPVVIMTAYGSVRNAVTCTQLGIVAYLQKPFKIDKISEILDQINEQSRKTYEMLPGIIGYAKQLIEKNENYRALEVLRKGLSLDSSDGELYFLIGKINEKNHEVSTAQKYYQIAKIFGYELS